MATSAIPVAEPIVSNSGDPLRAVEPEARPGFARRAVRAVRSGCNWCFGVASLFVGLSVLAAVPLGQFLALGYLLEAGGRVARSGRIRDGFIGVRAAARFGGAALMCGLLWLPLYFMSLQAGAARIIDPYGPAARSWERAVTLLAALFVMHAAGALLRGGRVRHFLNPLNALLLARRAWKGGLYAEARDRVYERVVGLRLPYYFWLGLRGYAGAFLWLAVPLLLLGQGHKIPAVGVLGAVLLAVVVLYLPFLQARFARTRRFASFFRPRAVRQVYRRAPVAFVLALWAHLLFALPLYLLKIEVIPRDLVFLEGLVFLLFMFPARLIGGWAYARGAKPRDRRNWVWRWGGRFAAVPVVLAYVLAVWVSQHIGWGGVSSLYEQHAFLLPVPFVTWK